MNMIQNILDRQTKEEKLTYEWQFALARRIVQILEEKQITQREFARRARLTEAQVSAMLHADANPTLAVLARISALLETDLLTWVNTNTRADVR